MATPRGRVASKFGALRGGAGGDNLDTYFGMTVPKEVKNLAPILGETSQGAVRKVLQLAIGYLKTGEVESSISDKLRDDENGLNLFLGMVTCLREALKNRVASNIVERDLITLQFPPAVSADVAKVIDASCKILTNTSSATNSRDEYEVAARTQGSSVPHLKNVRWRVDVAISTSSSHRALRPSIMMELTLTDGSMQTFELTIEEFHELRYNVAKMLKEFHDMEKSQLFKITEAWEKALQQQQQKKAAKTRS